MEIFHEFFYSNYYVDIMTKLDSKCKRDLFLVVDPKIFGPYTLSAVL